MGEQTLSLRVGNKKEFMKKAIVTGASGLLGRAILRVFSASPEWEVTGLAKNRAGGGLKYLDLLQAEAIRELVAKECPDLVIHAAAERRPDRCEGQPEITHALNVTATSTLCEAAQAVGAWTLFISTDYVFDGRTPPYHPGDLPHPLNAYGESKLAGERATLAADSGNGILRVPILYGEVEELGESAVTVIARPLLDPTPAKMDHWAVRRPTLVDDVASACLGLANLRSTGQSGGGVWHFGGDEAMTKYDMAMAMAEVLERDASHLLPDDQPPVGAPRPRDCSFDCGAFDAIAPLDRARFRDKIGGILSPHLS